MYCIRICSLFLSIPFQHATYSRSWVECVHEFLFSDCWWRWRWRWRWRWCRPCDRNLRDAELISCRLRRVEPLCRLPGSALQQLAMCGFYEDLEKGITCEYCYLLMFAFFFVACSWTYWFFFSSFLFLSLVAILLFVAFSMPHLCLAAISYEIWSPIKLRTNL